MSTLSALLAAIMLVAVASSASASRTHVATAGKVKLPAKTIGILGPVEAAETIHLSTSATETAARTLGWKTIRLDPGGDPAKMASAMTSLVNSHVDAIVLTVMEPATIQAGLRAAAKARIPVISTMAAVHSSPLIAATYWPPPKAENDLLIAQMKKTVASGAKIAGLYLPQFYNAQIAQNLFVASAKKAKWSIVAKHDTDLTNLVPDTKKAVGDILTANPDLTAIWGCCDFAIAGAVPAIQQARKNVMLFSLHGVPSSIQFIKSGKAAVEMSDGQKGSFIAIDALADYWTKGTPIPKTTPAKYAFKMTIVTKANASKGYPYPTNGILKQFKAIWSKKYILPGS